PIAPTVESKVHQVAPLPAGDPANVWTRSKPQAVVLLQGFHPHPLGINVAKAEFRGWQKADAPLIKELAKNADVFVFAYGQNVPIDVIAQQSKLPDSVATLKRLG